MDRRLWGRTWKAGRAMVTKSLFGSHISEEAEYAALLKEMIQSDFLELAKCFTSSDIGSIGAGENWLTAVERAMTEAKAVIVLCSKASCTGRGSNSRSARPG